MRKKFCDNETCRRPFGLVQHRWYGYRFCRIVCKEDFLAKIAQQRERMKQWLGYLRPS